MISCCCSQNRFHKWCFDKWIFLLLTELKKQKKGASVFHSSFELMVLRWSEANKLRPGDDVDSGVRTSSARPRTLMTSVSSLIVVNVGRRCRWSGPRTSPRPTSTLSFPRRRHRWRRRRRRWRSRFRRLKLEVRLEMFDAAARMEKNSLWGKKINPDSFSFCTLFLSLYLSLSLSLTHTLSHVHSLSHKEQAYTHALSCSLYLSLAFSLTHIHSLSFNFSLLRTRSLNLTPPLPPSLPLFHPFQIILPF